MISPSAYYACTAEGVPVVQSLDNPRLICPTASLFRDGHLCEDCLNKTPPWPGVLHACYRNSRLQTAAVAGMLTSHRLLSTWQEQVNLYLVATHFYRQKFIQAGLPPERLALKPHFVTPDPQVRTIMPGDYALFIGRLDPEKGIPTLLEAWKQLSGIPLRIRGGGQLLEAVQASATSNSAIQVLDRLGDLELTELIKGARFLVWPSEGYYETFGFVAAEAFACSVPVIASDIGVTGEMVEDGVNGLLFEPGNATDLIEKVTWAWAHPQETVRMGQSARRRYEEKFSPLPNYHLLIDLYQRVIEAR
jgi:glycosyltransferase involved in cell wall biosynthesis